MIEIGSKSAIGINPRWVSPVGGESYQQTGTLGPTLKMKMVPATRRGAPTGNRPEKFGLPEWIARIGAILIEKRPIVEIGFRWVFLNPAVGAWQ